MRTGFDKFTYTSPIIYYILLATFLSLHSSQGEISKELCRLVIANIFLNYFCHRATKIVSLPRIFEIYFKTIIKLDKTYFSSILNGLVDTAHIFHRNNTQLCFFLCTDLLSSKTNYPETFGTM